MDLKYISELLQALLLAILPVLAAQGVAILLKVYQQKRAQLSEQQRWMLDNTVNVAVLAAEQMYKAGNGAEKKAYALGVVEDWIAKSGLTIDAHLVEAQIEASVFNQLNNPPVLPQG